MTVSRSHRALMLLTVGLFAANGLGGCAAAPPFPPATPAAVEEVINQISPSVVRIDVAQEVYRGGKRTVDRGIGSGVIIDQKGRILTNFHVAGRSVELYVTLASKERLPAKLIGDDHWTDLAIIQLDMDEVAKKKLKIVSAQLGRSDNLLPVRM
jgi:serine protease Do